MLTLFSTAARSFVRVFLAALLVYAGGVLAAPDLSTARSLGLAALLGALSAGLRALQVYAPQISIAHWIGKPYGDWADAFLHGFLASLLVTVPGLLNAPDLHTARQLAVAAIVGAVNTGIRAVQGLFTKGERPAVTFGVAEPPPSAGTPPTAPPAVPPVIAKPAA